MAHKGPKAKRFSYSNRTDPPPFFRPYKCSQPIVQAAQDERVRSRATLSCSGAIAAEPAKFLVGNCASVNTFNRLNASRFAAVPSSRYLAVAGPNDFSRVAERGRPAFPVRPRTCAPRSAHDDGFDVFRTEHGPRCRPAPHASRRARSSHIGPSVLRPGDRCAVKLRAAPFAQTLLRSRFGNPRSSPAGSMRT